MPGNGTETSLDYGRSIAVHELSDGTQTTVLLVIGAPGANFPEWPVGGGRVYLYRLANGIWHETQVITPSIKRGLVAPGVRSISVAVGWPSGMKNARLIPGSPMGGGMPPMEWWRDGVPAAVAGA